MGSRYSIKYLLVELFLCNRILFFYLIGIWFFVKENKEYNILCQKQIINLVNKYFLSINYLLGVVLRVGDIVVNIRNKVFVFMGYIVCWRRENINK